MGVYYSSDDDVVTVPLDGGAPTTLATGQSVTEVAADAENVYWLAAAGAAYGVFSKPLVGGPTSTLATGQYRLGDLLVDETNVYWVDSDTILRVPVGGGSPVTLATGQLVLGGFAVDSTSLYWLSGMQQLIQMTPK